MNIPYYVVSSFTDTWYKGNPAGVCLLEESLPDSELQKIAATNALSETTFVTIKDEVIFIRWFTPQIEIDLCGHATLASAKVIFEKYLPSKSNIVFKSPKHSLTVFKTSNGDLTMDFPIYQTQPIKDVKYHQQLVSQLEHALNIPIKECLDGHLLLAITDKQQSLETLVPDIAAIANIERYIGVVVTAKGDECDFVSRFFAPKAGIPEDPVTGSAHCLLTPYWAKRLNKSCLQAKQLSSRGGEIQCTWQGRDRVELSGKAVIYQEGCLHLA